MTGRALVAGAGGFIGRHAVAALLAAGWEVHAVTTRAAAPDLAGDVRWHRVDLSDAGARRELLRRVRPSHLLHLAWYVEHGAFWESPENGRWLTTSLAMIDEFEGERVVAAGTCAEYDWTVTAPALAEFVAPIAPATAYGRAKDALRREAAERLGDRGISFAWGRLFFLHGPYEHPARLVPSVARALLAGEPALCTEGRQIRDFLHTSDAGAGFAALLAGGAEGPVNVASGEAVTVATLVGWIGEAVGRPELVELGALPTRPDEPPRLVADVARLRDEVGFRPALDPRSAVERTVSWWAGRAREGDRASPPAVA